MFTSGTSQTSVKLPVGRVEAKHLANICTASKQAYIRIPGVASRLHLLGKTLN